METKLDDLKNMMNVCKGEIRYFIAGNECDHNQMDKDIEWLIEKAEKLENIEKAWREGSGEDIDIALQYAFE